MSQPPDPPTAEQPTGEAPTCYRHSDRETWIRCQRCERPICPDCMNNAAVGFQCPSCVAEGRKSTRSGQTPYGGRRTDNPRLTTVVLIGINAVVWLAVIATGGNRSRLVAWLAESPVGTCLSRQGGVYPISSEQVCATRTQVPGDGLWVPGVADGGVWQLLTGAFMHVEIWHIALNMLALWLLGPQLELALGRVRFLALYLLSALAGSVAVLWLSDPSGTTLGASGAIFGLFGALVVIAHRIRADMRGIMTLLGINLFITVVGSSFISWQGHLGGLVGGFAVAAILVYSPRGRRTPVQVAGLTGVLVLLVVLTVVRIAALT